MTSPGMTRWLGYVLVVAGLLLVSSSGPAVVRDAVCERHIGGHVVVVRPGDDLAAGGRTIGYGGAPPCRSVLRQEP